MPTTEVIFDVFLSHAHENAAEVKALAEMLRDEFNVKPWLDIWECVPGTDYIDSMSDGLNTSKTCAVFIGKQTPDGWFKTESHRAMSKQEKDSSYRVIPVILPGGNKQNIEGFLKQRTQVEFKTGLTDKEAITMLVSGIRGIPPGRLNELKKSEIKGGLEDSLRQLQNIHLQKLVDDDVVKDVQRKLLEQKFLSGQV